MAAWLLADGGGGGVGSGFTSRVLNVRSAVGWPSNEMRSFMSSRMRVTVSAETSSFTCGCFGWAGGYIPTGGRRKNGSGAVSKGREAQRQTQMEHQTSS